MILLNMLFFPSHSDDETFYSITRWLFPLSYISLTDQFIYLLETRLSFGGALMIPTWMTGGCWRRVGCPTNRTLSIFSSNFLPHMSDLVAKMVARMMSENLFKRARNKHSGKCHRQKQDRKVLSRMMRVQVFTFPSLKRGPSCNNIQQWQNTRKACVATGEEERRRLLVETVMSLYEWGMSVTCWLSGKSCCN